MRALMACVVVALSLAVPGQAALYSNGNAVSGTITIDGVMSDWTGEMLVGSDTYWDLTWDNSRNLMDFYMANDETMLYGRFTTATTPPEGTGTMINTVTYYLDADNNTATGGTYSYQAVSMSGIDFAFTTTMGAVDNLWPNNTYKWNSSTSEFDYAGPTSAIAAADGVTGVEFGVSLATIGNDGATPIKWIAVQNYRGDVFGGDTWGGPATLQTYAVVPEPMTLAMLAMGGVTMFRRRVA